MGRNIERIKNFLLGKELIRSSACYEIDEAIGFIQDVLSHSSLPPDQIDLCIRVAEIIMVDAYNRAEQKGAEMPGGISRRMDRVFDKIDVFRATRLFEQA
jgi:hypothetical protein